MTLAYLSPLPPTLRLVRTAAQGARRSNPTTESVQTPAGHPGARSWKELPWEDDDWAWYAVEHRGPLDLEEIGALLGVDESTVRLIEDSALSKLEALDPGMTGAQLGRLFAEWDRERHAARRARESAARVALLVREFAREYAGAAE